MKTDLSWLPPYQVRVSSKAKTMRISITEKKGLELVLPRFVSKKQGLAFLASRRDWIEKHADFIADIEKQLALKSEWQPLAFPVSIHLRAIDQYYQVRFQKVVEKKLKLMVGYQSFVFFGDREDFRDYVPLLEKKLKSVAKRIFKKRLDECSKYTQLPYDQLIIRGQKTRWGSCSRDGSISLNYKLLFFSEAVVRYVMIHELCHTRHMNHSKRFWNLVQKFVPDYQAHIKMLKDANNYLPDFLE